MFGRGGGRRRGATAWQKRRWVKVSVPVVKKKRTYEGPKGKRPRVVRKKTTAYLDLLRARLMHQRHEKRIEQKNEVTRNMEKRLVAEVVWENVTRFRLGFVASRVDPECLMISEGTRKVE